MNGEVRNLKTGVYNNEDGSASLRIVKTDDGVKIDFIDFEFDLYEGWTITDDGKVNFRWGNIREGLI